MPVKTVVVNRWEVQLDGDLSTPSFSVTPIDADDKSITIRLGTTERTVTVEDWVELNSAVRSKVKYTVKR